MSNNPNQQQDLSGNQPLNIPLSLDAVLKHVETQHGSILAELLRVMLMTNLQLAGIVNQQATTIQELEQKFIETEKMVDLIGGKFFKDAEAVEIEETKEDKKG